MQIKTFVTGPIQVNTYLVWDEQTNEAILIDIGGNAQEIANEIKSNNLKLKAILNTHGHFDHVLGVKELQEILDVEFYVHEADSIFVENLTSQLAFYGLPPAFPPKITGYLNENSEFSIGETKIKFIETPGHTPGGLCLLIDNALFSGDTLFRECIGRTDFPGGSMDTLLKSIKEKLFILPDDTKVYPGHEASSTIGHEKKYNMFV